MPTTRALLQDMFDQMQLAMQDVKAPLETLQSFLHLSCFQEKVEEGATWT